MPERDDSLPDDHIPYPEGILPTAAHRAEIQRFLDLNELRGPARLVKYADGPYDPNWCHVSAAHKAITEGGRRVHGWALWAFGEVIVDDHHSVWMTPGGELVDVTPPKYGSTKVPFVPDPTATIEEQGGTVFLLTNRTSVPAAKFMWDRKPSEYSHVPIALNNPGLVKYCARLGIATTAILTDGAKS